MQLFNQKFYYLHKKWRLIVSAETSNNLKELCPVNTVDGRFATSALLSKFKLVDDDVLRRHTTIQNEKFCSFFINSSFLTGLVTSKNISSYGCRQLQEALMQWKVLRMVDLLRLTDLMLPWVFHFHSTVDTFCK